MTRSATRRRREIKYLLSSEGLEQFQERTSGILTADRHGSGSGGYFNHSIYFDSPSGRYGREKTEGLALRTKPRIRIYRRLDDFAPVATFLELKHRQDDYVIKERIRTDFDAIPGLLDPFADSASDRHAGSEVVAKFAYLRQRYDLRPMVSILYRRQAFSCEYFPGFRITFDRSVSASDRTAADTAPEYFRPILPSNRIVLEVKYNDRMPNWVGATVESMELQQVSISKYVTGVRTVQGGYFAHHA